MPSVSPSPSPLRLATAADVPAMLDIYAPFVRDTAVSFEDQVPSVDAFCRRLEDRLPVMPWLACELDGALAGYAYAGPFRERPAYRWTVEVTVYVGPHAQRRGVAGALYTSLIAVLRLLGYRAAIAVIALPNDASVSLHESFGFTAAGVLPRVGFKLERWHDIGWWTLELDPSSDPLRPPRRLAELAGSAALAAAVASGLRCLRGPTAIRR